MTNGIFPGATEDYTGQVHPRKNDDITGAIESFNHAV
jgi:hypothetical protein